MRHSNLGSSGSSEARRCVWLLSVVGAADNTETELLSVSHFMAIKDTSLVSWIQTSIFTFSKLLSVNLEASFMFSMAQISSASCAEALQLQPWVNASSACKAEGHQSAKSLTAFWPIPICNWKVSMHPCQCCPLWLTYWAVLQRSDTVIYGGLHTCVCVCEVRWQTARSMSRALQCRGIACQDVEMDDCQENSCPTPEWLSRVTRLVNDLIFSTLMKPGSLQGNGPTKFFSPSSQYYIFCFEGRYILWRNKKKICWCCNSKNQTASQALVMTSVSRSLLSLDDRWEIKAQSSSDLWQTGQYLGLTQLVWTFHSSDSLSIAGVCVFWLCKLR